ncbi:MAG: hypothetical protein WCP70_02110 [Methanothrix sp.]
MNSNKINWIKAKILHKLHRHGYWGGRHTSLDNLPKGFEKSLRGEVKEAAEAHPGEDYYRRAVAVGDAKSWKIQLDKSRKGQGSFEMQNPSFQIDVYLRDTPPKWAYSHLGPDLAALLRARLRGLFGGAQKEQQEAASRSGQTGACTGAAGRVRGVDGQTRALEGADQADGRADRCDGVQAVRTDGRGDRDCAGRNSLDPDG